MIISDVFKNTNYDDSLFTAGRLQMEYPVNFGREVKRADIVIMDKDRPPSLSFSLL